LCSLQAGEQAVELFGEPIHLVGRLVDPHPLVESVWGDASHRFGQLANRRESTPGQQVATSKTQE